MLEADENLLGHESFSVEAKKYIYFNSVHSVALFCLIDKIVKIPLVIFVIYILDNLD